MTQTENLEKWLKAGCQRQAVAQVLTKPMIPSEIFAAAKQHAPRIQLRDVWFILNQMESKGLVSCLNPDVVTGKLFYWTESGNQTAAKAFSVTFPPLPSDVAWNLYSWVIRGSTRRKILIELAKAELDKPTGLTPSNIKRRFKTGTQPIWKNQILITLGEMNCTGLVIAEFRGRKKYQRRYRLTGHGKRCTKMILC
jgi:DNA-binding PadR family transcriptional regulator